MAKRVALDTLEAEALEIPLPDRTVSVEEVDDEKVGKRPLPQWLLISALALVILIVAGGIFYWFMRPQKTVAHAPTQGLPAAVPLPPAPLTVQVNDFIIPLQNHQGKYLVMTCDLTFELGAGQDVILRQNMAEVRKIIYGILAKTRFASPPEQKIKSRLKEEINTAVSGLLGQDAVKAIYFTKFVVL